jgi:hypothetical protein
MLNEQRLFTTVRKEKYIRTALLYGLTKYVKLNDLLLDALK